jgi:hypothetical protein
LRHKAVTRRRSIAEPAGAESENGFIIEGLAEAPGGRLFIGFRNPRPNKFVAPWADLGIPQDRQNCCWQPRNGGLKIFNQSLQNQFHTADDQSDARRDQHC